MPTLTKREHFAAMALQGMFANEALTECMAQEHSDRGVEFVAKQYAESAVTRADALIAALKKDPKKFGKE